MARAQPRSSLAVVLLLLLLTNMEECEAKKGGGGTRGSSSGGGGSSKGGHSGGGSSKGGHSGGGSSQKGDGHVWNTDVVKGGGSSRGNDYGWKKDAVSGGGSSGAGWRKEVGKQAGEQQQSWGGGKKDARHVQPPKDKSFTEKFSGRVKEAQSGGGAGGRAALLKRHPGRGPHLELPFRSGWKEGGGALAGLMTRRSLGFDVAKSIRRFSRPRTSMPGFHGVSGAWEWPRRQARSPHHRLYMRHWRRDCPYQEKMKQPLYCAALNCTEVPPEAHLHMLPFHCCDPLSLSMRNCLQQ